MIQNIIVVHTYSSNIISHTYNNKDNYFEIHLFTNILCYIKIYLEFHIDNLYKITLFLTFNN